MDDIDRMYQENILDHYKNPRNKGKIENPSVQHHEKNPLCGDELSIYLIIEDKNIVDVKFDGHGCAISQASASLLSEEIKGKSLEELNKFDKQKVFDMLGIPLSAVRIKCALLSLDTLKNSILIYEKYVIKK
jgi:nitrogen fixation NifU-like protein|tara:strand:+ start:37872 stop:38267 length:396 start_codon:yes stop_codon:yes gene_type:complete